jgi:tetratricopeptide (TPR) repeat protein
MKKMILTGLIVLLAGSTALIMAQQGQQKGQPQGAQGQQGAPAQAAPQQQLVPGTKSAGESQAVIALFQAQSSPDAIIKAADELLTTYADTVFKEQALYLQAAAYQQKGDLDKAQIFAERVLEVNPKNYQSALMIGEVLAQRTRENDLDKEEKLTRATKLLGDAIAGLNAAQNPNPQQLSEAQWLDGKKFLVSQAHNDLGMIALTRKKYDVAITEFKTANDGDSQPAYQVRLATAYQLAGNNAEAVVVVDKILADPQLHPTIKKVAESIKAAASKK